MKAKHIIPSLWPVLFLTSGSVFATDYQWDGISSNATLEGGDGTWSTGATNWTADSGASNVGWTNLATDNAIFSAASGGNIGSSGALTAGNVSIGSGYTVTLNGNVTATQTTINTGGNLYLYGAGGSRTLAGDIDFQGGSIGTGSGNSFIVTGKFTGGDFKTTTDFDNYFTQNRTNLNNSYTGSTTLNNNIIRFTGYNTTNFTPFGSGTTVTATATSNSGYGSAGVIFAPSSTSSTYSISQNFTFDAYSGKKTLIENTDGILHLTGNVSAANDGNAASGLLLRTQYNGKNLYLDGVVSGSGNIFISNLNSAYGRGSVYLTNGSNTYSGKITVNDSSGVFGILGVDNANAAAGATIALEGTTNGGRLRLVGANVTVAGLTGSQANAAVFTTDATSRTLTVNNAADNTYAGRIGVTGSFSYDGSNNTTNAANLSLSKSGAGTLTLTGTNAYTGTTNVTDGKLLINGTNSGSGLVTVDASGTLGGTGSIAAAVNVSGVLAPGASIESLSTGALSLQNGATLAVELNSDTVNADALIAGGNLSLSGTVNLTLADLGSGVFTDTTTFTLLNYSGTWNGGLFSYAGNPVADDSTFTALGRQWKLDYNNLTGGTNFTGETTNANFVLLSAVPEPSALLLTALGLPVLLRRRR